MSAKGHVASDFTLGVIICHLKFVLFSLKASPEVFVNLLPIQPSERDAAAHQCPLSNSLFFSEVILKRLQSESNLFFFIT